MKHFTTVAAIFIHERQVGAFRRKFGRYQGYYEFVGGKIEAHESHAEALKRECKEEIGIDIHIHHYVDTIYHVYEGFTITLHAYYCSGVISEMQLRVHDDVVWCARDQLYSIPWLEADYALFRSINDLLDTLSIQDSAYTTPTL